MKLAEDILDVTRIESGSFFFNKEKFNLQQMITAIFERVEQNIQSKSNIKLYLCIV